MSELGFEFKYLKSDSSEADTKVRFRCRLFIKQIAPGENGLPQWLSGKEFACIVGDVGSIPGSQRSPGGGNG